MEKEKKDDRNELYLKVEESKTEKAASLKAPKKE